MPDRPSRLRSGRAEGMVGIRPKEGNVTAEQLTTEAPRGRGRPRAADRASISAVAYALFRAQGFDRTTMDDIAKAAGIGRTTLWRYFESKSDILWDEFDSSTERFRSALARAGAGQDADVVFAAYRSIMTESDELRAVTKARLAVVAVGTTPTMAMWEHFDSWARMIADFLAARRQLDRPDAECVITGRVLWAALWCAVSEWSLSEELRPDAFLDRARAALAAL